VPVLLDMGRMVLPVAGIQPMGMALLTAMAPPDIGAVPFTVSAAEGFPMAAAVGGPSAAVMAEAGAGSQ